jgi:RNA polymerase primary sigma factor
MSKDKNRQQQPNHQQGHSPLARLIQLGRDKSFITSEDILQFFPNPESDVEALDRIYAALIAAEIPYRDK